jgi:hypothetical protein
MAEAYRRPDDPLQGSLGTGKTTPPRHTLAEGLEGKKITTLGLGEYTRGGPGSRAGTTERHLRDFGQSH